MLQYSHNWQKEVSQRRNRRFATEKWCSPCTTNQSHQISVSLQVGHLWEEFAMYTYVHGYSPDNMLMPNCLLHYIITTRLYGDQRTVDICPLSLSHIQLVFSSIDLGYRCDLLRLWVSVMWVWPKQFLFHEQCGSQSCQMCVLPAYMMWRVTRGEYLNLPTQKL